MDLAHDGTGRQTQTVPLPSGVWVYGDTISFAADADSSDNPVTVTSRSPQVCEATDAAGSARGEGGGLVRTRGSATTQPWSACLLSRTATTQTENGESQAV